MNDCNSTDVRKEIARSFCKSILWIDDQIAPLSQKSSPRSKIDGFPFQAGADAFAKAGILCHLFAFPQLDPSEEVKIGNNDKRPAKKEGD